jgi:acetate kinase
MQVLALNCGSSSIKAALIDTATRTRRLDLRVESIGAAEATLSVDGVTRDLERSDAQTALSSIFEEVSARAAGRNPEAVAHRIVHGGEKYIRPTVLDEGVVADLASLDDLAPLHNPFALAAVRAARARLPDVPHVAVFDTAFHSTLPARAREYALPRDLVDQFGIRRFGFHGTSHAHVAASVAAHLRTEPQNLRVISCHLGNGASVAAIEYGRSVETSMGMTPLEGLVMGTRCGDIDPGILLRLMQRGGFDADALERLLNSRAGLRGLTGTNDMREIEARAAQGDEQARLALSIYSHRVRKYIGAYAAVMGGVDVIAFTGGIGENSAGTRHRIAQRLDFLGARLDEDRNRDAKVTQSQPLFDIADESSRVKLLVVRADEELTVAMETAELLASLARSREPLRIPVAVSARHAHLSQQTLEQLFGPGFQLTPRAPLSQPGQFSANETVSLIGPRGRIDNVRLLGPARRRDQVEISRTDEFTLGVDAPVRISGDLQNTPGITLEGPRGRVTIANGLIVARRHIHMGTDDAQRFGVKDCDVVSVRIDSDGRDVVFEDVSVRVSPDFQLELHLDTDEANAAGVGQGALAEIVKR